MNFETVLTQSKKQKFGEKDFENQESQSSSSSSLDTQQNEEEEEFKKIERNPNYVINVNRIHEILLSRNYHDKNNLLYIEKIADPGQINNYFRFTQINEAIVTMSPNKPITNNSFVKVKILIFFEKQENVVNFKTISEIKKNKRLLSKNLSFALEKNSQDTQVFEINKQKYITTKSPVYRFNKSADKRGKSINISKYSLYYAINTYYTSSNKQVLHSQLKYDQLKRENFLLEKNEFQNLTEEINTQPDTIKFNIEFIWKN